MTIDGWSRAAVVALVVAARANAQDDGQSLRDWLRPGATIRTGIWSATRDVDGRGPLGGMELWGDVTPRVLPNVALRAAGWMGAGRVVGDAHADARLRELYADVSLGSAELRIGKQIVAWGRADAINPTDNVTPRDLTLLVPDDDDQKSGVPGVRAAMTRGGTTVSALWLAGFSPTRFPGNLLPPGTHEFLPSTADALQQGAIRLDHSGGRVDWSASYLSGFDLNPDAALAIDGGVPHLELTHHRIRVLGGDAATALGRYGVRAEVAWMRTEDANGHDPAVKNGTLFAVIGVDRTFGGYLNINLQYVVRSVLDFVPADTIADPARRQAALALMAFSQQLRATQQGATVRVADEWLHETLKLEISGVALGAPRQYLIRPRARYAISDRWQVVGGIDRMWGRPGTLFELLHRNSLTFVELRLGL